jgi:transcriptional regulator with GAF, ATPase, and Fis domain
MVDPRSATSTRTPQCSFARSAPVRESIFLNAKESREDNSCDDFDETAFAAKAVTTDSTAGRFSRLLIELETTFETCETLANRGQLTAALEKSDGVRTKAADLLKISYRSFRHYAKKHSL